jgi:hypothetical protein
MLKDNAKTSADSIRSFLETVYSVGANEKTN